MKNLLILRPMSPSDLAYLRSRLSDAMKVYQADSVDRVFDNIAPEEVHAIACNSLPAWVMNHFVNLEFVQVLGAGVDRVDLTAFREKRVLLGNSHSNAETVAEHALALTLFMTRRLSAVAARESGGEGLSSRPFSLQDRTVGILGFGAIGKSYARFVQALGANVCGLRRKGADTSLAVTFSSKDQLLSKSDIVLVSLPRTLETVDYLDERSIAAAAADTVIVSISRPDVVNETAIAERLMQDELWYATDCWGQPTSPQTVRFLWSRYSAAIDGARPTHLDGAVANLRQWAAGEDPSCLVNLEVGY